jgi:tRNA dimethylallyltransferase
VERLGKEKAYQWLSERDHQTAIRLHPNDTQRVCRALEKTFDLVRTKSRFEPLGEKQVTFIGLERSREKLDIFLRARTEAMWKGGLLNETKAILESKIPSSHPLWGAIGYLEALAFLKGELKVTEAKERIFRRTRQYAKRQWTWFKHQHAVQWINLDDFLNVSSIVKFLCQEYIGDSLSKVRSD